MFFVDFITIEQFTLRYKEDSKDLPSSSPVSDNPSVNTFDSPSTALYPTDYSMKAIIKQLINFDKHTAPTRLSSKLSVVLVCLTSKF